MTLGPSSAANLYLYDNSGNANARYWAIKPSQVDYGDLSFMVGASQGAAPSIVAAQFTRAGALALTAGLTATTGTFSGVVNLYSPLMSTVEAYFRSVWSTSYGPKTDTDILFKSYGGATLATLYTTGALTLTAGLTATTGNFSGSVVTNTAALATSATDGFLYVPTCAGAPTGVPTTHTGTAAIVLDTTNNKLYVYNGSWKSASLA